MTHNHTPQARPVYIHRSCLWGSICYKIAIQKFLFEIYLYLENNQEMLFYQE